jgi:hypothetical protein
MSRALLKSLRVYERHRTTQERLAVYVLAGAGDRGCHFCHKVVARQPRYLPPPRDHLQSPHASLEMGVSHRP